MTSSCLSFCFLLFLFVLLYSLNTTLLIGGGLNLRWWLLIRGVAFKAILQFWALRKNANMIIVTKLGAANYFWDPIEVSGLFQPRPTHSRHQNFESTLLLSKNEGLFFFMCSVFWIKQFNFFSAGKSLACIDWFWLIIDLSLGRRRFGGRGKSRGVASPAWKRKRYENKLPKASRSKGLNKRSPPQLIK